MGEEPEIAEIREREEGSENTDAEAEESSPEPDPSGGSGGLVPSLGLSRRQMLLIGLVVVAVLAWQVKRSSSDGGSSTTNAGEEIEKARDPDLSDVKVTGDEEADEPEIVMPVNPDDELEKDEAAIEMLRQGGHIGGDD